MMMRLSQRGGNAATVEIDGMTILFSYSTPVAVHICGQGFFKTKEKFSVTTSRHINAWLRAESATMDKVREIPQEEIAGFLSFQRASFS